jgi:hypothetical protein
VWEGLSAQEALPPDEVTHTMLARAAAARGDADGALRWADAMAAAAAAAGAAPGGGAAARGPKPGRRARRAAAVRLRTYQPALVALALAGRADEALAVVEGLAAKGEEHLEPTGEGAGRGGETEEVRGRPEASGGQGRPRPSLSPSRRSTPHSLHLLTPYPQPSPPAPPPTESEYALLLEAIARGGTYAQFASVMGRMQAELNQLRPSTLDAAARFLASPAAAAAFAPGGPMEGRGRGWAAARWVSVDGSGLSAEAGACWRRGRLGVSTQPREMQAWAGRAHAPQGLPLPHLARPPLTPLPPTPPHPPRRAPRLHGVLPRGLGLPRGTCRQPGAHLRAPLAAHREAAAAAVSFWGGGRPLWARCRGAQPPGCRAGLRPLSPHPRTSHSNPNPTPPLPLPPPPTPPHPTPPPSSSNFMCWLPKNGPFHVILDGANIGLYGHFSDPSVMRYEQVGVFKSVRTGLHWVRNAPKPG